jgi:hypothetical protein
MERPAFGVARAEVRGPVATRGEKITDMDWSETALRGGIGG